MPSCSKDASWHCGKSTDHPHLGVKKTSYELTSHRPISLLPIASIIFEKLSLKKRLLIMVENGGFIPNHQFGLRQRHSTIKQTHQIVQGINEAVENKQYFSAAFLDTRGVHKVSFPLGPHVANLILREATACT
jgi:hypothetical protein